MEKKIMSEKDESIEIETVHGLKTKIPSKWLNKEGKKSEKDSTKPIDIDDK